MNILGIGCYFHDGSATLVRDGKIVAAAEEERFTRIKHDSSFPAKAIEFCLSRGGITFKDLDCVCFYEKPFRKFERFLSCQKAKPHRRPEFVEHELAAYAYERLCLPDTLKQRYDYSGPIEFVEHHLAHAASAYYISSFEDAAIMTIDGVGEWTTTAQYKAENEKITLLREIQYPHSIGLLYSTITGFLGFKVNEDEYKVMGLASYGKPTYLKQFEELVTQFEDASYRLNMEYFSFMDDDTSMYHPKLIQLLGPARVPESEISQTHMDIAATLQRVTEEMVIRLGKSLYESSGGKKNLCLAGGVALNGVSNWRLFQETPFEKISIQPASGDGGGSMGAALYCYNQKNERQVGGKRHSTLLGPDFTDQEIESMLKSESATFQRLSDEQLFQKAAELISKNQIVGWFQGKMEFGPRALGNRSILGNACNPEMKDILNLRVKFREDFRPFAPAVLEESASEYFDIDVESPYMLLVAPVKNEKRNVIPSVTHSDGTARVQTVSREDNPRFYELIREFQKLSKVPVVINTSFNVRGEPIVCTPSDAYHCFLKTDIDYLFVGNYLVEKDV